MCMCFVVAVSKPGLHRMNAPDGRKVFIQFSYAANETTNDDLFNKHLLRNIDRANVHISNVFRDIAEDVYRKRRRQLETYSTSTLPENQPVYLNEVSVTRGMFLRENLGILRSFTLR